MEVDTQKDIEFYFHLITTLDKKKVDEVAPIIFGSDLSWMDWEARRKVSPKAFFYKIVEVDGEIRLVSQRDLLNQEDILQKISRGIRFGLEFAQMSKVRSRLLSAENGAVAVWISPKKILPDDPDYPLDQINIAKKINKETVWVKQLQGDFTPAELASFVGIKVASSMEELMLTIGELGDVGDFSESTLDKNFLIGGISYTKAIKLGLSAEQLREKRNQILFGEGVFVSILTSCGVIEFGKPKTLPSWCEHFGGGIRCKHCKKGLSMSSINFHRCVC